MPSFPSRVGWLTIIATLAVVARVATVTLGLAQPPPAPPAPAAADGKALYAAHCANCHGDDGRGEGAAAALLNPAPRNFTKGVFKFRSTASGSLPSDDDLARVISAGLPGTSMSGWNRRLSAAQIGAIISYVKTFSPRFATERPTPVALAPLIPTSPASIEKGRKVYADLACGACHGDTGTTFGAVAVVLQDDWAHDLKAADLTQPWTFRAGATAGDVYLRLKTGINGTPMPSFADTAKDADLWNVANFVVSLGRKPVWQMTAEDVTAHYDLERKDAAANPVERGRYLAATLGCAHCHSPVDASGRELPGLSFAGGQKFRLEVWGDVVSANLTSDNQTGIGRQSDADLKRAITRGIKDDETRMLPFPMGWPAFASLSDPDLTALVAFLRTIPPVNNEIPEPARLNIAAYLSAKFQMLILGRDYPIVIFAGNAGSAGAGPKAGAAAK
ncbi:MAG: c-type cytochrome [Acidobacteriota bacterium]